MKDTRPITMSAQLYLEADWDKTNARLAREFGTTAELVGEVRKRLNNPPTTWLVLTIPLEVWAVESDAEIARRAGITVESAARMRGRSLRRLLYLGRPVRFSHHIIRRKRVELRWPEDGIITGLRSFEVGPKGESVKLRGAYVATDVRRNQFKVLLTDLSLKEER